MIRTSVSDKLNLEEIVQLAVIIMKRLERINYNRTTFSDDDFVRDSFIPPIMHIGENINHLHPDIGDIITNNHVREIVGMRNRLAHAYLGVDTAILWTSLIHNVPELGLNAIKVLESKFSCELAEEKAILKVAQETIEKL